ncbi:unnamed protein product [Clonostachys rosea]|uniref:CND01770-like protein n=1 Tax=Bionectria ochroleuca TaxID=29856 RepID=A0ABY6UGM8_BIOOC|nr:unnamed protein product [Clonostachys rosea]
MYIPTAQSVLTAGLALTGTLNKPSTVSEGKVLDFAVEKCIDADGNRRCTDPFLVTKSTCYHFKWSTEGTFSHTTAEVRDAGSNEIVHYSDTDGDWKPEKGEVIASNTPSATSLDPMLTNTRNQLVYIDFKPKIPGTGNSTVEYKVTTCK